MDTEGFGILAVSSCEVSLPYLPAYPKTVEAPPLTAPTAQELPEPPTRP